MATPTPETQRQLLLKLGPFGGLLNTSATRIPPGRAAAVVNVAPNRVYGAFKPLFGRASSPFCIGNEGLTDPLAIQKFIIPGTPQSYIVQFVQDGATTLVLAQQSQAYQFVTLPNAIDDSGGSFVQFDQWMFFTNLDPTGNGAVKLQRDFSATAWQISAPALIPVLTLQPGTPGFFATNVYYRYTYSNANQESSPCLSQAGPVSPGQDLQPPGSNTATLSQTPAPALAATTGTGSIPAGVYYGYITFVDGGGGEGGISLGAHTSLSAPGEITFTPPTAPVGAVTYNTYLATGTSSHLQSTGNVVGSPTTVTTYDPTGQTAPPFEGAASPPPAPVITAVSGGSQPARNEFYVLTYTGAGGAETFPSQEASISLQAGQVSEIASPPAATGATGYKVYGSQTSGQEVLQTSSPIAIGTAWTAPNASIVLGEQVQVSCKISPDPQTTTINVYRLDIFNTQWLFVGSVPNTSGFGGAPNNHAFFVDTTPDPSVAGQTLIEHRDVPAPFFAITAHKNRIWGFGHNPWNDGVTQYPAGQSDLWYSNPGEPWGFDNTNQVIQVNADQFGDIAVGLESVGGVLVCFKTHSTWILMGDSPNDFQPPQELGRGLGAFARTIVQAQGVCWWLSNQGVMRFDGNLTNISADIKPFLDALGSPAFEEAAGCFNNGMYWLSFPGHGVSYGYDEHSQMWVTSDMVSPIYAYDPEGREFRPFAIDTVIGLVDGVLVPWFYGFGDRYNGDPSGFLTSSYTSGTWAAPRASFYRFVAVEVLAPGSELATGAQATLVVVVNPLAAGQKTYTYPVVFGNNPWFLKELPFDAQGTQVQVTLQVAAAHDFEVYEVNLYGYFVRDFNTNDSGQAQQLPVPSIG